MIVFQLILYCLLFTVMVKIGVGNGALNVLYFYPRAYQEKIYEIAKPYATFESVDGQTEPVWEVGRSFSFDFKMFGFIPLGVHVINVKEFNPDNIYTNEGNLFCPVWNHRIILKETADGKTEYTDEVEIGAGWKTPFVYLWAKAFYLHRQKKWIKLLNKLYKENVH